MTQQLSTKIKNYTSEVPPQRSIEAIEKLLVTAGALYIGKLLRDGKVTGFTFSIPIDNVPVQFKLPVKVEAVEKLFAKGKWGRRLTAAQEQAQRTAWRLLYDWVSVQLSMIRLGQAEVMEIFMPYAYDARSDLTLYEHHGRDVMKALSAPAALEE